ncbi:sushi domain-containing protein 2-like isoform X1 [Acipenser oxyrinchus oxyrinchus]|uniref:Sushi domain-containing protein 2-like isoform X1 n=1 Tax=Acipenser oxyrinchus oxyrinchus TaxID=40147 RepID=A0AAD8G1V2_ACIOX|nr:sushi domain-containing protein 2-like isoform X1 [Acipenser oxyrinchus oxyrinchus]
MNGKTVWERFSPPMVTIVLIVWFSQLSAAQSSCESRCGQRSRDCSCQATCESLKECCADYRQFCLQISPHSGTLLGGAHFVILNTTFDPASKLVCRFNSEINTQGYVDSGNRGHCASPLLYESGWIPFEVSTDNGATFNRHGTWLAVHHSKVSAEFKITLHNATKWQYYGTPNTGGSLTMSWNASLLTAAAVNVELWGYRETGEAYSDSWKPELRFLYSLGKAVPNSGSFTFVPHCAKKPFSDWEIGALRVSPSMKDEGDRDVAALWTGVHALAWHLEEKFRKDSAAWAYDKCISWHETEQKLPDFLSEIADCPCTLAQSRADTGRFHVDYGCDIEKGSVCTYHPGSVHCVRAIQASPKYGAGQQCCYDHTGAQVLTADSIGGSTPDRGHDWGSPPYRKPPRVPGVSHWLYDVITFYYCCLWSDNCHYYFTHRPSSDCRTYRPPRVGVVFGDPHFITLDGSTYTFNGKGEYYLLNTTYKALTVQVRTEPVSLENGSLAKATRLSAVAMQESGSDVIEVRTTRLPDHLEVLRNQQVLSFSEQSWMDLKGVFLYSSVRGNVSVMFPSGAGVEVRGRGGLMTVSVLLPEEFLNHTSGLLGSMNNDPQDDFMFKNGSVLFRDSSPEDLFVFGADWAISNETSLFTYDTADLLNTYFYAEKHDPAFVPVYSVIENPDDPLYGEMSKLCGQDPFCKFDTMTMKNLATGNATKISFQSHVSLVKDLEPVLSCGWLAPPTKGKKEGTTYLVGSTVKFTCNKGYVLTGSAERTCLSTGMWSGDTPHCVSDNILGIVLGTENSNKRNPGESGLYTPEAYFQSQLNESNQTPSAMQLKIFSPKKDCGPP